MSITGNNHEFTGVVVSKHGPYTVTNKQEEDVGFRKFFLICKGDYVESRGKDRGKALPQFVKFVDTLWKDNIGYNFFKDVFPGDEVKFMFSVRGRYEPSVKGRLGEPSCWQDLTPTSKIEILSTQNRKLYDNEPKNDPVDDLGTFDVEPPKQELKDGLKFDNLENDDATRDLPFSWLIPFLLPLATNFII